MTRPHTTSAGVVTVDNLAGTKQAREASTRRLEAMARGPQAIAATLASLPDEELTDANISVRCVVEPYGRGDRCTDVADCGTWWQSYMRAMLCSNPQLFGSCVAFMDGVFNGEPRHNVYCCRSPTAAAPAAPDAEVGATEHKGSDVDVGVDTVVHEEGDEDDSDSTASHDSDHADDDGLVWKPLPCVSVGLLAGCLVPRPRWP